MRFKDQQKLKRFERQQAKEIDRILARTQLEIRKLIRGLQDKDAIEKRIPRILETFFRELRQIMVKFNILSCKVAVEKELEIFERYYFEAEIFGKVLEMSRIETADTMRKSAVLYFEKIRNYILLRTFPIDNISVGSRITTLQRGALKTIRNIIAVGLREGESWVEMARKIDQYIAPEMQYVRISPWEFYRKRFKVPKTFDIRNRAKIPAGSVSYNAHRIARTEISLSWREATIELNKDKFWCEGFEIHRAPGRPPCDICDSLVARNPYPANETEEIKMPHPNCVCYITTKLMPKKEFLKLTEIKVGT